MNSPLSTNSRSTGRPTGRKLQTAPHAEYEPGAYLGCDGDENFPDAVFQIADIVIQLHEHFYHVRALEVQ